MMIWSMVYDDTEYGMDDTVVSCESINQFCQQPYGRIEVHGRVHSLLLP